MLAVRLSVAGADVTDLLEGAEGGLDAPAFTMAVFVLAVFVLAVFVLADLVPATAFAGDDRRGTAVHRVSARPIGVVTRVGG